MPPTSLYPTPAQKLGATLPSAITPPTSSTPLSTACPPSSPSLSPLPANPSLLPCSPTCKPLSCYVLYLLTWVTHNPVLLSGVIMNLSKDCAKAQSDQRRVSPWTCVLTGVASTCPMAISLYPSFLLLLTMLISLLNLYLLYATSRWPPSLLLPPQNPFFPPLFNPLLSSFPPFSIPPVLKRGKMVLTPSKNLFYPSSLPPFHPPSFSGPSTLPSSITPCVSSW